MTVLLTGATGFLGSHLLQKLLFAGHEVFCLKRSFSDMWRLRNIEPNQNLTFIDIDRGDYLSPLASAQIDTIIHCATHYGRMESDPFRVIEANLLLPLKILSWAANHGVKRFINSDTILNKRINSYSLSKTQFRDWLQQYSDRIACINISLEHFYGPGDDPSKFSTMIVRSLLSNVQRIPLTQGHQKRDFIYIDDVVEAYVAVVNSTKFKMPGFFDLQVGSGEQISVRDFVTLAQDLSENKNTELGFGDLAYRDNEIMEFKLDLEPIYSFGWRPQTSLSAGLKKTFEGERDLLSL